MQKKMYTKRVRREMLRRIHIKNAEEKHNTLNVVEKLPIAKEEEVIETIKEVYIPQIVEVKVAEPQQEEIVETEDESTIIDAIAEEDVLDVEQEAEVVEEQVAEKKKKKKKKSKSSKKEQNAEEEVL